MPMMHDYIIQTCLRLTLLAPQKPPPEPISVRSPYPSPTLRNSLYDKQ